MHQMVSPCLAFKGPPAIVQPQPAVGVSSDPLLIEFLAKDGEGINGAFRIRGKGGLEPLDLDVVLATFVSPLRGTENRSACLGCEQTEAARGEGWPPEEGDRYPLVISLVLHEDDLIYEEAPDDGYYALMERWAAQEHA